MRQMNDHLAPILFAGGPRNVTQLLKPIHQLDGAVMFELQTLGQLSDGRRDPLGQPFDGQQELVLLRLHAHRPHLLLAKAEESPDLVAELGQ